jgi:hypothetical protein
MTRENIKQWVEARIDEVLPRDPDGSVSVLIESPANFIDEELDPSALHILYHAPREALFRVSVSDKKHHKTGERDYATRVITNDDGSGKIVLPTRFLRFVSMKLSDWKRPVESLLSQDDPNYKLQFNEFQRGTIYKPVGVLVPFSTYNDSEKYTDTANSVAAVNINQAIEFFTTSKTKATLESLTYIPRLLAEEMPDDLLDAMVWYCAGRILQIMKLDASPAYAMAEKLLGEIKPGIIR